MRKNLCSNKKVLLISNMYPSEAFPHYGVFVKNTAEVLSESGLQVDCIGIKKSLSRGRKLCAYIVFHIKIIYRVLFFKYNALYAHYISHTAFALMLVRKIRPHIPIVVNVHGNDIVPEDKKDERYLPLIHKVKAEIKTWIVPSVYFKEILEQRYQILSEKIIVYPSGGIDCNKFIQKDAKKIRKQLGISSTDFLVGYVGRIEKNKGWDTLVKAMKLLQQSQNDVKCIMVGTGEFEDELESLMETNKVRDRIIRKPLMGQDELVKIYNAIDVFCLPSYRKSESLALVGLEAMACGCVVLGSNMAGPSTYIEEQANGFLFEAQNEEDLANKLKEIQTKTEDELAVIKENARKTAEDYDKHKVKEKIVEVFGGIK